MLHVTVCINVLNQALLKSVVEYSGTDEELYLTYLRRVVSFGNFFLHIFIISYDDSIFFFVFFYSARQLGELRGWRTQVNRSSRSLTRME